MAKIKENDAKSDVMVGVTSALQSNSTLEEDAYEQPTTTRKELWSYYLYYNGDNGVGPGSYSQTL